VGDLLWLKDLPAAEKARIGSLVKKAVSKGLSSPLGPTAQFREAAQRAGVTAPPEVTMAGQVYQVPAQLAHASSWHG
jgi:hypothetical protein